MLTYENTVIENSTTENSGNNLADAIGQIRSCAQHRLASLSRLDPQHSQESYLFADDQFCGVRFTLGRFRADWRIATEEIRFFLGDQQIDRIETDPAPTRRAA